MTHKNNRKTYRVFWTKEELDFAQQASKSGASCAEIAAKLRRSEDSVRGKLKTISTVKTGKPLIPCLRCRRPFASPDKKRIRFCNRCRETNREAYDNTAEVGNFHL